MRFFRTLIAASLLWALPLGPVALAAVSSGTTWIAAPGNLAFNVGGLNGRYLVFEDWLSTRNYTLNSVITHSSALWVALSDPAAGDEPGVAAVWEKITDQTAAAGTGAAITAGTADPTGGSDGDAYFQVDASSVVQSLWRNASGTWTEYTLPAGGGTLSDASPENIAAAGNSGTSTDGSRSDHVHDAFSTATPAALGASAVAGTGAFASRNDHVHRGLSDAAPEAVGTADAGTAAVASRDDHVHAGGAGTVTLSDVVAVRVDRFSEGAGTGTDPSREDHQHRLQDAEVSQINAVTGLLAKTADLGIDILSQTWTDGTSLADGGFVSHTSGNTITVAQAAALTFNVTRAVTTADSLLLFVVVRVPDATDLRDVRTRQRVGAGSDLYIDGWQEIGSTGGFTYGYSHHHLFAGYTARIQTAASLTTTHFRGSADAENVDVDASAFAGNLSSTDTDTQAALATIDGLTLGGASTDDQTAGEVAVSVTNFNGNLGAADNDVQAALETLDDVDASDIPLVVTDFDGNLGAADNDVQAAFETLDDLAISTAGTDDQTAAEVTANTFNFTGNLSGLDTTVQFALQTLDDLVVSGTDDQTAAEVPVAASGFDGNLTTTDDTVQEVAQKLDDLITSVTATAAVVYKAHLEDTTFTDAESAEWHEVLEINTGTDDIEFNDGPFTHTTHTDGHELVCIPDGQPGYYEVESDIVLRQSGSAVNRVTYVVRYTIRDEGTTTDVGQPERGYEYNRGIDANNSISSFELAVIYDLNGGDCIGVQVKTFDADEGDTNLVEFGYTVVGDDSFIEIVKHGGITGDTGATGPAGIDGGTDDQTAAEVTVSTTNFGVNLSATDDSVQEALDTLDDLISGGTGDITAVTTASNSGLAGGGEYRSSCPCREPSRSSQLQ